MYESRTLKRGGQIYDLVSGGMVKTVITPSKVALNQWKKAYPSLVFATPEHMFFYGFSTFFRGIDNRTNVR